MTDVTPTYTFSGDPSTSPKDAVRFWIQDMGPTVWLVSDQAIEYVLAQFPNVLMASAQICRSLAAKFAQMVTKKVGDLSINYSDKSKQYLELADDLEAQASSGLMPYAGGISKSDMLTVDENPNRVRPPFSIGQFDDGTGPNLTTDWPNG